LIRIAVFIGSESDLDLVNEKCLQKLKGIGLGYDLTVCSAHRDPEALPLLVHDAVEDGIEIFIGYAGLTPALPGAIAACARSIPVIGVSDTAEEHRAITNTAPGVPVMYAGWGKNGLTKAAELAAQLLGWKDEQLSSLQMNYVKSLSDKKPPRPHHASWDPEKENRNEHCNS
jgi:5-(carboxyamino)imidazole ribonucleotide mutase